MRIDPILLRTLRRHGLTDSGISRLANDVSTGDARSIRYLSDVIKGMIRYDPDTDQLIGVVPIARGVHWCAGQLRVTQETANIPHTMLLSMPGSPITRIMEHEALPADARIRNVADAPGSFGFVGEMTERDRRVALLDTDVGPVDLPEPDRSSMLHRYRRMRRDAPYREPLLSWWKGEPLASAIGIAGIGILVFSMIYAAGLGNLLRSPLLWLFAGIVMVAFLVRFCLLMQGGEHRKEGGWIHREAKRRQAARLRAGGF